MHFVGLLLSQYIRLLCTLTYLYNACMPVLMRYGKKVSVMMEFCFHTTYNSTQQQHVQKHYPCISRPLKFYLKIKSQTLDLYTGIYGNKLHLIETLFVNRSLLGMCYCIDLYINK